MNMNARILEWKISKFACIFILQISENVDFPNVYGLVSAIPVP
jgi:hypothetical protein